MVTTVKEVEWGIANTYQKGKDHVIEINSKLQDFPILREKIISHEREHSHAKGFWKNRKVDALTDLKFKDLFPVYKKYPRLFFQQNIPINYSKEKDTIFIDWSLVFLYLFYGGVLALIYYVITLFSSNSILFWKIVKNAGIVLGIVIVLSFTGKKLKKIVNKEAFGLTKKGKKLKKLGKS